MRPRRSKRLDTHDLGLPKPVTLLLLHVHAVPLIAGCENGCSRHGLCTLQDGEYSCECSTGWAGRDCSIRLEMECNDFIDNDEDGMMDCSDSECCSHAACAEHIMCLTSNNPVDVLLRKQPPSVTASFYQRVKFLVEENSVQSYAHMNEYTESFPHREQPFRGEEKSEKNKKKGKPTKMIESDILVPCHAKQSGISVTAEL
ncbi:hypothetical protein K0M31_010001 [Melipona bicolor]|uniref:EGF-like domain-containing protein n=1 Tax=Melipona bicolor TaxID=60889 RepID=A0AA40KIK8_9HYME|nr:hypothetical protein K0M31_010001 [Melipona bicolor]